MKRLCFIIPAVLSGCALLPPTEHAPPNATLNKWQVSCTNKGMERNLLQRSLKLVDESSFEWDPVARQKNGIINQKLLDSDELCGSKPSR
jgi:hypothetical protein